MSESLLSQFLLSTFSLPLLAAYHLGGQSCSGDISLFELRLPFQYAKLAADNSPLAHLVSMVPLEQQQQLRLNQSGDWRCARTLDGLVLGQPRNNPSSCNSPKCFVVLRAMAKWIPGSIGVSKVRMVADGMREQHEGLCDGLVVLEGFPPIFCGKEEGFCGASIPLYSFYSHRLKDQILTTKETLGNPDYAREFGGNPICYIWPFPSLQIISPAIAESADQEFGCNFVEYIEGFAQIPFTSTSTTSTETEENDNNEEDGGCFEELSTITESSTTELESKTEKTTLKATTIRRTQRTTRKLLKTTTRTITRKPAPVWVDAEVDTMRIETAATAAPTHQRWTTKGSWSEGGFPNNVTAAAAVIIITSDDDNDDGREDFLNFLPRRWKHGWHLWILLGAISALLFCCCVTSTLLCHLLCLQSVFAQIGRAHV